LLALGLFHGCQNSSVPRKYAETHCQTKFDDERGNEMSNQQRQPKFSDMDKRIKARHLQGKRVTLTIQHVGMEIMPRRRSQTGMQSIAGEMPTPERGEGEPVFVLWFKELGARKSLVLSNPNREKLIELFGDDPNACIGKKILLEAQRVSAFGKTHDVVRITGTVETERARFSQSENDETARGAGEGVMQLT
jgi:hypothetical protein